MSKYSPLAAHLRGLSADAVKLSFQEIESLIDSTLPRSAYEHAAWWANSRTDDTHSWAHLWLEAGWERGTLDMSNQVVEFHRSGTEKLPLVSTTKYWWVNHKQTYLAETEGNYIWSPKANQNGARNQTYDNLMLVRPGDMVISYAGGVIQAIGIAMDTYKEVPKPQEFGKAGENWSHLGWHVQVEWTPLLKPVSPKAHMVDIAPLLPKKNSPLQANGNGNQGCYLASVSDELGKLIFNLAVSSGTGVIDRFAELQTQAQADDQQRAIERDESLSLTEREQLTRSRIGQGLFRKRAIGIEPCCRLTGVVDPRFLVASHIKPWKDCSHAERLDGNNGLMLAPHADKLFDRGWLSFEDNGDLLVANQSARTVMTAWGLGSKVNVGSFSSQQRVFLSFHRDFVFLKELNTD